MKYEPHKPVKIKAYPWLYCSKCGLLYLKNRATDKAVRQGCNWNEPTGKELEYLKRLGLLTN